MTITITIGGHTFSPLGLLTIKNTFVKSVNFATKSTEKV